MNYHGKTLKMKFCNLFNLLTGVTHSLFYNKEKFHIYSHSKKFSNNLINLTLRQPQTTFGNLHSTPVNWKTYPVDYGIVYQKQKNCPLTNYVTH